MTITLPGGIERRIPPPEEGDCKKCRDNAHSAMLAEQERRETERTTQMFFRWSQIGPSYQGATFENFVRRPGTDMALDEARRWVDGFDNGDGSWLMLHGDPGNGKTHLGMAIRNAVAERYGCLALAVTQPYLLAEIRATWNRRDGDWDADDRSEEWMVDKLQLSKFLLLDDLMPWEPWAFSRMFNLFDGRYRNGKKLVMTSNLAPAQLKERLDDRIWDRVMARTIFVPVTATSFRVDVERKRL